MHPLKSLANCILSGWGYELRRSDRLGFNSQDEALAAVPLVRKNTMVSTAALVSLWDIVAYVERAGISGDLVECGVWKGGAAGFMALSSMRHSDSPRRLHLFDVFDDICPPDPAIDGDRAVAETRKYASGKDRLEPMDGVYDAFGGPGDAQAVERFIVQELGYSGPCELHVGWFQDTLPHNTLGDIAVLRLDGDWYASTLICLETLYHKVVPGGFVVIDDYGTYDGCRAAVDEFLATLPDPPYLNALTQDVRYLIKR